MLADLVVDDLLIPVRPSRPEILLATDGGKATFTHANAVERTYTLPDASGTLATTTTAIESGTWSAVTGSRSLDNAFQNTSGKKRRVSVILAHSDADNPAALEVENANPPTVTRSRCGPDAALGGAMTGTVYAEVPNGWYYRVSTPGGSNPTLVAWHELDE